MLECKDCIHAEVCWMRGMQNYSGANCMAFKGNSDWIAVAERLPEMHRELYDGNLPGYVSASDQVLAAVQYPDNEYIAILLYTERGWFDMDGRCFTPVKAWMPLPGIYKEE